MLGVKWFHTHTRIFHVTTATTPPAAMTPASWFMGCERVMGWRWWWWGGAVLFYDNAVPLYSHKWREWENERREARERRERERERADSPSLAPTWVCFLFFSFLFSVFSVTRSFCFSQLALHADRMVIFIVIIALNLRVHLWKGSDAQRNSSESWWIRISIMPLAEDYTSLRTVNNANEQIRQQFYYFFCIRL